MIHQQAGRGKCILRERTPNQCRLHQDSAWYFPLCECGPGLGRRRYFLPKYAESNLALVACHPAIFIRRNTNIMRNLKLGENSWWNSAGPLLKNDVRWKLSTVCCCRESNSKTSFRATCGCNSDVSGTSLVVGVVWGHIKPHHGLTHVEDVTWCIWVQNAKVVNRKFKSRNLISEISWIFWLSLVPRRIDTLLRLFQHLSHPNDALKSWIPAFLAASRLFSMRSSLLTALPADLSSSRYSKTSSSILRRGAFPKFKKYRTWFTSYFLIVW